MTLVARMRKKIAHTILRFCLLWLTCFAVSTQGAVSEAQLKPLPVKEDLSTLSFPVLTHINMSPDGQWVAYTLQDPRRSRPFNEEKFLRLTRTGASPLLLGCDIWITNTKSGQTTNLTEGRGTSWSPVWSPDSNYLAFYSDRSGQANVWLWEKSSRSLRPASGVIVRSFYGHESVAWTPDSKKIVAKVIPAGMTVETVATLIEGDSARSDRQTNSNDLTLTLYKSAIASQPNENVALSRDGNRPGDSSNVFLADLTLINIADGGTKRLARERKAIGIWLSPDGSNLAFTSVSRTNAGDSDISLFDLSVISLTNSHIRTVASRIPTTVARSVSWSPDGTSLSYITSKGDCFLVPISGGVSRNLTQSSHPSFDTLYRAPVWDSVGRTIYLLTRSSLWSVSVADGKLVELTKIPNKVLLEIVSPAGGGRFWSSDNGRSMYLLTRDEETKETGFYKVDLTTGRFAKLSEEQKFGGFDPIFTIDTSGARESIVYAMEDVQHPADIWIASADMRNRRQLTKINPNLDSYEMGTSRLIEWNSVDGQRLRGALLLPAGYQQGHRYPLVVVAYGGYYKSNYVYQFGLLDGCLDNMQLFATRGYAVLLPDAPLRVGTPMQDIAKTILPGVDVKATGDTPPLP